VNVTVPFSTSPEDHHRGAGDNAYAADAVNTIKLEGGKLIGYNTDGIGLSPTSNGISDFRLPANAFC